MKNNPQIGYDNESKRFTKDGEPVDYDTALEIFNDGSADWSQGAYWAMAQILGFRAQNPV